MSFSLSLCLLSHLTLPPTHAECRRSQPPKPNLDYAKKVPVTKMTGRSGGRGRAVVRSWSVGRWSCSRVVGRSLQHDKMIQTCSTNNKKHKINFAMGMGMNYRASLRPENWSVPWGSALMQQSVETMKTKRATFPSRGRRKQKSKTGQTKMSYCVLHTIEVPLPSH